MLPPFLPGLPSIHGIIEAIANGFFGALATALVPGFLKHASVATLQALVALPDPAVWPHVSELQGDMTFLGVLLLPVTLAAGVLRYWLMGLTGGPSPVIAVSRAGWATGLLVAYRWLVEQVVAAANTLTHAILGFPVVSDGLGRIVGVLFGGALLAGAGGVFGALLVIVGVVFAAALFAAQVLVTLVLALLTVAGPPLIAVSVVPELSHLARSWAHALVTVALVPVGWTVLFATAGALALDATSFTGGAGGLPEHVAAAFAGLITFVLAVRLPVLLFAQARHLMFAGAPAGTRSGTGATATSQGADRVRAAHARLRSVAFDAAPAVGRTVGAAAGALGAPAGGAIGLLRRRAQRTRDTSNGVSYRSGMRTPAPTIRQRVGAATSTLRDAPRNARAAMRRDLTGPVAPARRTEQTAGQPSGLRPAGRRPARPASSRSSATDHVQMRFSPPAGSPARRLGVTSHTRPGPSARSPVARSKPAASRVPAGGVSKPTTRPATSPRSAAPARVQRAAPEQLQPEHAPVRRRRKPRPGGAR